MQTTVLGQKSTSLKPRLAGRGAGLMLSALLSLTLASAGAHAQQPAAPGNPMSAKESQNHQAVGMYNLGLSAYQQGSLESAIIFFRRATDLDPNLADAQYNLGVLYQSQRRAKEAIPRFQEVLRVKPSDADAHYQLGLALMEMGRPAEAKTHFASIAPNSTHFADAQKRTQVCDAQMSGATIAEHRVAKPHHAVAVDIGDGTDSGGADVAADELDAQRAAGLEAVGSFGAGHPGAAGLQRPHLIRRQRLAQAVQGPLGQASDRERH
ncbi:MAG TPA: tetratricopeptide repeat protein, partial [Candidatus Obscuribacter sp.]|nr:tetratricopeptide repeat protein [Candidatus Obscuribacter sp.]